ncbi:MAG TPA: zinc-binding alcohol dehydrogenase family protein [Alloacidobacterium sp.]|jgi:threonine dehydrogenase-like Zn-dependent dehydrogenase|nr:zinc-binding alcohol dehydrogenase family protein [Alloacidobacterium sp.]
MRAIQLERPGAARLIDVAEPKRAGGDALLRVRMVGMCGSDLNTFRGKNPMVSYPRIPGHEVAATVIDPGNSGLQPGTNVTLSPYTSCNVCASCRRGRPNACKHNQTLGVQRDGAMTEMICVPGEKLYAAQLDLKMLCLVEPLTVGTHAVSRGRVTAQDTVAVFGCGGVGLGAITAAAFRGAKVVAIDVDDTKLETARKAGASLLLNTTRDDLHLRLQEYTNGLGPDVVIEAIGLPQTFQAAVEEAAFTGRVVYIGYAKTPVSYETSLFVQKELDILGSRNALPEDFREVIRLLEAGRFPVEDAISVIGPLADAPRLLTEWSDAPANFTKIMISLD